MSSHLELYKDYIFEKTINELKEQKKIGDLLFYDEFEKVNKLMKYQEQKHTITDLYAQINKLQIENNQLKNNQLKNKHSKYVLVKNYQIKTFIPQVPTVESLIY